MSTDAIPIYNRRTRAVEAEKVPGGRLLARLYNSPLGRWICTHVLSRRWFSRIYGWPSHRRFSHRQIDAFARSMAIDMTEVDMPTEGFATFNDFFIRTLKPGARPVDPSPHALVSPADSRFKVFPLNEDARLNIKGVNLSLRRLLGVPALPAVFAGGLCLQFRLAPSDYHRFGYIVDGAQGPIHAVGGRLYSVNPLALRHVPDIWWRNYRQWCVVESALLGTLLQIEVGATVVGSIVQRKPSGGPCRRGAEKGYFQMGGSTVLIVVASDRIVLDDDIRHYSRRGIETLVRFGETIGRILRPSE